MTRDLADVCVPTLLPPPTPVAPAIDDFVRELTHVIATGETLLREAERLWVAALELDAAAEDLSAMLYAVLRDHPDSPIRAALVSSVLSRVAHPSEGGDGRKAERGRSPGSTER